MRILFIGSANSSKFLLKKCFELKLNIVGVCTQKRSRNDDFCDLKKYFKLNNNLSIYTKNINSYKNYLWIKNKKPDLIFCFGWSQILNKNIIKLAKKMTIGFHPSELPKNRGKHPIIWSLVLGLKKTASTFFIIKNEKVDSGTIVSQKIILISKSENASSLYKKIITTSCNQLRLLIRKIENNIPFKFYLKKTNESNYWRKRSCNDGRLDWRMSATSIYNLVRALSKPYNNATFIYKNKKIKILRAKIIKKKNNSLINNLEPGKILKKTHNYFDVKCGEGVIRVLETSRFNYFQVNQYL
jgi:methionyl-tRNA formyltransferase